MKIFPAIDLYGKKAVRLYKGNYDEMTVYNDNPLEVALDFKAQGAEFMHLVDLEGARDGGTPNLDVVERLVKETDLFVEVGGGIRNMDVVDKYIGIGVGRVILGTAAVTDQAFLCAAVKKYGSKIAVGVDLKDGMVATHGWTEKSGLDGFEFCANLQEIGVSTIISTDISKDGAMQGANHALYRELKKRLSMNVIASGGVSSIEDIIRLKEIDVYGAIIGKAYYTGAIELSEAIKEAK